MVERLRDGGHDERQAFRDGAGPAGEVDDKRAAAHAGGGAGEDGGLHLRIALQPHDLAEAGQLLIQHGARGLGRHIARRRAGPAGGEDEGTPFLVSQPAERGFERGAVVGQQDADPLERFGEKMLGHALDLGAAGIGIDAAGRAVAEGDAGDLHCLCFSRTRMPPMLMAWSTALHMS